MNDHLPITFNQTYCETDTFINAMPYGYGQSTNTNQQDV